MLAFSDYTFYAGSLVAAATALYQTRNLIKGPPLPSKTATPSTFISYSTASIHRLAATVIPTIASYSTRKNDWHSHPIDTSPSAILG